MATGTGSIVPVAEAQQVRMALGLRLSDASAEAGKRGISISAGVIRGLETGRHVADSAKLYGYLKMLKDMQDEREQESSSSAEPDDRSVAEQIVGLQAQQAGLEHFIGSRLGNISIRDMQLLSGALHAAHIAYRNAASILQGAASQAGDNRR